MLFPQAGDKVTRATAIQRVKILQRSMVVLFGEGICCVLLRLRLCTGVINSVVDCSALWHNGRLPGRFLGASHSTLSGDSIIVFCPVLIATDEEQSLLQACMCRRGAAQ